MGKNSTKAVWPKIKYDRRIPNLWNFAPQEHLGVSLKKLLEQCDSASICLSKVPFFLSQGALCLAKNFSLIVISVQCECQALPWNRSLKKKHRGSPNNGASGNGWLNSVCFSNERLTSVTSHTHSFRDLSSSGFLMWRVSSGRKVSLEFCWGRRANAASIYWVCQKSQKQKWSPVQESTS